MKNTFLLLTACSCILYFNTASAQISPGIDTCVNSIQTEGYILQITPDARSASLGEMGTAISPDENAVFHNTASLASIEKDFGFSAGGGIMRNYYQSSDFYHVAGYYKINSANMLTAGGKLLRFPDFKVTDSLGNLASSPNPYQSDLEIGYARKLNKVLSAGIDLKYITEDYGEFTAGYINGIEIKNIPTHSFATDLSLFYQKTFNIHEKEQQVNAGLVISNIGNKMAVTDYYDEKYFLPQNLSLGGGYKTQFNKNHSLFAGIEFNKLLVPAVLYEDEDNNGDLDYFDTNPIAGIFKSFADAPCGCDQELQEIAFSTGLEYWFRNLLSARIGYYYAHDEFENNRLFTSGLGVQYKNFELDLSMQVNTIPEEDIYYYRATLLSSFHKKEKS